MQPAPSELKPNSTAGAATQPMPTPELLDANRLNHHIFDRDI